MKELFNTYGKVLVNGVISLVIIGLFLTAAIFGTNATLLSATGTTVSSELKDTSAKTTQADTAVSKSVKEKTTISNDLSEVEKGKSYEIANLFSNTTDKSAAITVNQVKNSNGENALKNGDVTYQRGTAKNKTATITFMKRGTYSVTVTSSGTTKEKRTFSISVVKN